ncbi:MAG: IclR family transcriptional regulator, partial [Trebonia sp.]
ALLRELGLVDLRTRGTFVVTPQVYRLAAAAKGWRDLEMAARPTLRRLSDMTTETAFLMRRSDDEAIFVASAEPERALALSFRVGSASVLHRGAVAKVLLAFSSSRFQSTYIARHIDEPAQGEQLALEMKRIRKAGHAESTAEVDDGIWGGAVPVLLDRDLVASVSIAGPESRIGSTGRRKIIGYLEAGAEEIARQLSRGPWGTGGQSHDLKGAG